MAFDQYLHIHTKSRKAVKDMYDHRDVSTILSICQPYLVDKKLRGSEVAGDNRRPGIQLRSLCCGTNGEGSEWRSHTTGQRNKWDRRLVLLNLFPRYLTDQFPQFIRHDTGFMVTACQDRVTWLEVCFRRASFRALVSSRSDTFAGSSCPKVRLMTCSHAV